MKVYEEPAIEILDIESVLTYDITGSDEDSGFGEFIGQSKN